MIRPSLPITTAPELGDQPAGDEAGLGALRTGRGNLPLERLDLRARITGLLARTELEQGFHNPHDEPLEATYVFPLPDRAAVTGMRMTAGDRVIEATLAERGAARAQYDQAIAAGRRAAIAEEERPDVFTMRVGNILPDERVTVTLTLAGPLPYEDGAATFRFPLVVAPRYIPGTPLPEGRVGDGYAPDTDAVPDASRITPPVLLPGFPHPVRLGIEITLDTGGLPLAQARCSLPVEETETGWRVRPGQRADRDLVLRLGYGDPGQTSQALTVSPDRDGGEAGTFQLTVLPPTAAAPPRPRDVVLVLDRSGSMRGWKLAAARRAAARIVDTLTTADRFAVLSFDSVVERPPDLPAGLVPATDRHRFRAVEHLAGVTARGGTELLAPLREALGLLTGAAEGRDAVLVLVTDGQVGNEDQILAEQAGALATVRTHTIGIDQAVNAGFLGRLAAAGGGRCELVESEDRLDEAADRIHRRIGSPLVTGIGVSAGTGSGADGLVVEPETVAPARIPDLFPGAPLVLAGRYRGAPPGTLRRGVEVTGTDRAGAPWRTRVEGSAVDNPAAAQVWARAHLRDLEDRYVAAPRGEATTLEQRMVGVSLRFSVLCRFTAYVAVDPRTVTDGTAPHRVTQPVEPAAGWDMLAASAPPVIAAESTMAPRATPAGAPTFGGGAAGGGAVYGAPTFGGPPPRVRRAGRPAGGRLTPQPPVPVPGPDFAAEAARMRAAAAAPEPERRIVLADLASRLRALLGPGPRTGAGALSRLYGLLAELRDDAALRLSTARFTELWERMQALLDELGTGSPAPSPPPAARPTPRLRDFWKRPEA